MPIVIYVTIITIKTTKLSIHKAKKSPFINMGFPVRGIEKLVRNIYSGCGDIKMQINKGDDFMVQPLFKIYTRSYLSEVTGFSKGHLSRVNTGKQRLSRTFIDRCCYKLRRPEEELFLPEAVAAAASSQVHEKQ